MNANGLYSGLDGGAVNGVYNGVNSGLGNGVISNETRPLNIPLLDLFPGAAAAYSLRKLRTQYRGPAIRVRRSSDNAEQDIGFDGSGNLDEAVLASFVGANSAFVTTWYNQSGISTRNFTNSTAAGQPRIVNLGTIERLNGKPSVYFTGASNMANEAAASVFDSITNGTTNLIASVGSFGTSSNPNTAYCLLDNGYLGTTSGQSFGLFYDDRSTVPRNNMLVFDVFNYTSVLYNVRNLPADSYLPNQQNLFTYRIDCDNDTAANRAILNVNGGANQNNNTFTNAVTTATTPLQLGSSRANTFYLVGHVQELLFWFLDQSSNRTSIENNINSYYKIY